MRNDKASAQYWSNVWAESGLPPRVDPRATGADNFPCRAFDRHLRKAFAQHGVKRSASLLEIGAGNSAWLPYLALQYGVQVAGLDYSEVGCEKLRRILARDGVNGTIIHADLFTPPADALQAFDVVVSFGVAEHFEDTAGAIAAFARFLRPGGLLVTFVPNMSGILGEATRLFNRPVYDIHMPLDAPALRSAHEAAGLIVDECDYLVFLNLGVVNLNGIPPRTPEWIVKRALLAICGRALRATVAVEERTRWLPLTRATASFVVAIAHVPAQTSNGS